MRVFSDQDDKDWKLVRFEFTSDVRFLVWVAERSEVGYNELRGDIALDNVFVLDGNCAGQDCTYIGI